MNFFKPIVLCLLFALAGVLFATGCGSSDSDSQSSSDASSTATEAALTKAQLIKRGDAICKEMDKTQNAAMNAYATSHPEPTPTKAGREEVIANAGLPPIQIEAEELSALGAPPGDEAKLEAIVTGIEEALVEAEADPASTNEEGPKNPFFEVDELAREYGFKECAFLY